MKECGFLAPRSTCPNLLGTWGPLWCQADGVTEIITQPRHSLPCGNEFVRTALTQTEWSRFNGVHLAPYGPSMCILPVVGFSWPNLFLWNLLRGKKWVTVKPQTLTFQNLTEERKILFKYIYIYKWKEQTKCNYSTFPAFDHNFNKIIIPWSETLCYRFALLSVFPLVLLKRLCQCI